MKPLDFLIVGAQKCATTTLFEHLRAHPQIAMPLEKEVPFFTGPDCSPEAWERFSAEQFAAHDEDKLWGKASPQYMCDPQVPENIKTLMPDVKLVAILRDPIDRTRSHYQMGRRRATEHREFDSAVEHLLTEDALAAGRNLPIPGHTDGYQSEADFYVTWSEYGRILKPFTEHFGPDQLLVLYTEELQSQPGETLDRLLAFIGLAPGFRPPALGKVIHRGGGGNRIPHRTREWLRQRKSLYWLWQRLPEARRGRLRFQYEQWNVQETQADLSLPEDLQAALRRHYREDLQALAALPVASPPWAGRYLEAS